MSKERKDGYVQIAEIFEGNCQNENKHAKIWFKILKGGEIPGHTRLQDGVDGENYEWDRICMPDLLKLQKKCVFDKIAALFEGVAKIEKEHEERYKKLLDNVKGEGDFKRRRRYLAVYQLRSYCYWQKSTCCMSGLCSSSGIFPG